jgi:hypothetical protein
VTAAFAFGLAAAVTYDPARLVIGLGVAIALLIVAAWLVRTTDWHPPSEADTPELDRAPLDVAQ